MNDAKIMEILRDKSGWKVRPCSVNNSGGQSAYLVRDNPYNKGFIVVSGWEVYTSQKDDIYSEEAMSSECDELLGEFQAAWNLYNELTLDFFEC